MLYLRHIEEELLLSLLLLNCRLPLAEAHILLFLDISLHLLIFLQSLAIFLLKLGPLDQ